MNIIRCYNRYLELDRNSIVVTDLQLIKLQEMEEREAYRVYHSLSDKSTSSQNGSIIDPESAHESTSGYNPRVPRTFNIEVRGMHLVDRCVAGDVLICVGEVKMMQASTITFSIDSIPE